MQTRTSRPVIVLAMLLVGVSGCRAKRGTLPPPPGDDCLPAAHGDGATEAGDGTTPGDDAPSGDTYVQPGDCGPHPNGTITGTVSETLPSVASTVNIDGFGDFGFEPSEVLTTRPDIYQPGYLSLFDLLAHLDDRGDIDMTWHYDATLDTNVIDDLNGVQYWWYDVFFHGGWREPSVHRMDYYPVKDYMHLDFIQSDADAQATRHQIWSTEVQRRANNGGAIIIPTVSIRGKSFDVSFDNVEVTAHDLRPDMYVAGVPTAIDIIMSLGDQGLLSYEVRWRERMGNAIVNSWFLHAIDDDAHSGSCGFVYEVGEQTNAPGNHVHLMPDSRVLQSPEYGRFFWIILGSC